MPRPVPRLGQARREVLGAGDGERVDDPAAGQVVEVGRPASRSALGGQDRGNAQAQQPGPDRRGWSSPVAGSAARRGLDGSGAGCGGGGGGGTGRHTGASVLDVGDHPGVGRGRRREHRGAGGQRSQQFPDAAIVGAEVVPPVADAVRLVDDEQPAAAARSGSCSAAEGGVVEPLRTDQQDVDGVAARTAAISGQSRVLAEFIVTASGRPAARRRSGRA
jgi:hypothetical protein